MHVERAHTLCDDPFCPLSRGQHVFIPKPLTRWTADDIKTVNNFWRIPVEGLPDLHLQMVNTVQQSQLGSGNSGGDVMMIYT